MANNGLLPFAPGVWIATQPVRFLGLQLTATMTVLRLIDNSLLLYSPVAMTPSRRTDIETHGPIAHLYAPNLYHHLWIGEWATALPSARLHAPQRLASKRSDLRIDRVQGAGAEREFAGVIDEFRIEGFRLEETVLFHRPSRTLVVADLVHNVGRPDRPWTRFYTRTMGFYDRVGLSRMLRWTAFSDRAAARRSLDQLLALPFDNLIVAHGKPLTAGAREALAAAYSWLPAPPRWPV